MSFKCVVKIGGKDITQLAPVDYVETFSGVNKIPHATIRFRDWLKSDSKEKLLFDESAFKIGSAVVIEVGDDKSTKPIFNGIVIKQGLKKDAENGICYGEITAKDKAICLTVAEHVISFKDRTDDEILKSIISEQGLTANVSGLSLKHESFTQYNLTDWDLINIRAEVYGRIVLVDNGKVSVVAPKNSGGNPTLSFDENIISMDLEVNADSQLEDVSGKVWDIKSQKAKDVKANSASESSFGSIGYADLTKATQKQKSNFVHAGINTETEIKNAISGNLSLNRFSKIQGSITIDGNADVKPNTCVKLSNGSAIFQGNAYVSGVKNLIDENGWCTIIFIGLSGQRYVKKYSNIFTTDNGGISSTISGLQLGIVKKLDGDPAKESRIFVNIPTLHEDNGGVWCRFASFYASNKAGAVFYPEVGTEVVVGFLSSDPRFPVIIGSVFSSKNVAPLALDAKNEVKMIQAKNGMFFKCDEKNKTIKFFVSDKCQTVFSEDKIEIICGENKITLTKNGGVTVKSSKNITMEGQDVTWKSQQNIVLKAQGDVKGNANNIKFNGNSNAEIVGNVNATLKSPVNTIVKGGIVNIN